MGIGLFLPVDDEAASSFDSTSSFFALFELVFPLPLFVFPLPFADALAPGFFFLPAETRLELEASELLLLLSESWGSSASSSSSSCFFVVAFRFTLFHILLEFHLVDLRQLLGLWCLHPTMRFQRLVSKVCFHSPKWCCFMITSYNFVI